MVAVIVLAVPAVVPVKMAIYLPFKLSTTVLKVPLDVPDPSPKATVSPPLVNLLPSASLAIKVTSVLSPEEMELLLTDRVDWLSETDPGVTVTVGSVLVTAPALIVAVIVVAVPAVVPVKTAVYAPVPLSCVAVNVPLDDPDPSPKATVKPPPVNLFPFPSRAINVTRVVSPDEIEL